MMMTATYTTAIFSTTATFTSSARYAGTWRVKVARRPGLIARTLSHKRLNPALKIQILEVIVRNPVGPDAISLSMISRTLLRTDFLTVKTQLWRRDLLKLVNSVTIYVIMVCMGAQLCAQWIHMGLDQKMMKESSVLSSITQIIVKIE